MWLDAMLDYVIGDNYPNPVRCLKACEQPIKSIFKSRIIFPDEAQPFDIFLPLKVVQQGFVTCLIRWQIIIY